jgi:hypothetical protein
MGCFSQSLPPAAKRMRGERGTGTEALQWGSGTQLVKARSTFGKEYLRQGVPSARSTFGKEPPPPVFTARARVARAWAAKKKSKSKSKSGRKHSLTYVETGGVYCTCSQTCPPPLRQGVEPMRIIEATKFCILYFVFCILYFVFCILYYFVFCIILYFVFYPCFPNSRSEWARERGEGSPPWPPTGSQPC